MQDLYQRYGCANREEYLQMVADDYDIDIEFVLAAAEVLGPNEDFDGLINVLEDM